MSFESILTDHGATVEQWQDRVRAEYLRQSFWMKFAGNSDGAIIQVDNNLQKSAGDAINLAIRSQLIGGVVTGATKIEGNEGRIEFYNQRITVDNDNVAARMDNVPMVQQRVNWSTLNAMRDSIVDKRRLRTDDRITNALGDTASGRVRGRYLYGAEDSNWNATHATALQNVDATDDQLTTLVGSIAKRKAQIPINATAKMRPMKIMMGPENGVQEWWVFANHTYATRDMVQNDAAWKQPMLLVPPLSNAKNPIFTGSTFLGAHNGVLYYEWEGIELVSSTIQVNHGLFLGAQACAFVWAQFGRFEEENWNYGHDVGLNHHEINGVAKMVFDRNTIDSTISNEDNGVVHVFTSAVAD